MRTETVPTYAILGITGQVGGTAAELLLAEGAKVRAVVRSEAKATLWRDRSAGVALATSDDPIKLQAAFDGVDGVFIMTPTWFEAEDMFAENAKALAARSAIRPRLSLVHIHQGESAYQTHRKSFQTASKSVAP
jgi:uncharacterized protein YbjT (DUF2867 family)